MDTGIHIERKRITYTELQRKALTQAIGSGVEKILIFPDEVPQNHVLDLVIFFGYCAQPGVSFIPWFWCRRVSFVFILGRSSPGLPLSPLRSPLLFSTRGPAIASEVSHFITVVTLHLG
jgi:hypothetical protein